MSMNIEQIFIANPITTNAPTDLMYFGQSPYGAGDDAAMTFANFNAQIVGSGTANDLAYFASTGHAVSALATANNGVLVTSAAGVPSILAGPGVTGKVLSSNAAGAPSWTTATFPGTVGAVGTILRSDGTNWVATTSTFADTYAVSTLLYAGTANTVTGLATTNSAALVTNGSGVPAWQVMAAGQILIGTTAGAPTAAAINSGAGILVQNGSGTITISSTGVGSLVWNDVAGTTQAAAVNSGYIISNASQTTVTLPATAAEGSAFAIAGKGAAGWIMQANTGQVIHYGSSPTSTAGTITSTNQWDSVTIVCVTANTTFSVIASQGALTVA